MYASDARNRFDFLDDLAADSRAFFTHFVFGDAAQALHDVVGYVHARHLVAHVVQCAQRFDRPTSGQDVAAPVQSEIAHTLHPLAKDQHIEDELRLTELRAGGDLLAEAFGAPLQRWREWIFDRADEPVRRRLEIATR